MAASPFRLLLRARGAWLLAAALAAALIAEPAAAATLTLSGPATAGTSGNVTYVIGGSGLAPGFGDQMRIEVVSGGSLTWFSNDTWTSQLPFSAVAACPSTYRTVTLRAVVHFGANVGLTSNTVTTVFGTPPPKACGDGLDNDGDGKVDGADPGCSGASDDDEYNPPPVACNDGVDNDGDGLVDLADSGCSEGTDTDEYNPPPPVPGSPETQDWGGAAAKSIQTFGAIFALLLPFAVIGLVLLAAWPLIQKLIAQRRETIAGSIRAREINISNYTKLRRKTEDNVTRMEISAKLTQLRREKRQLQRQYDDPIGSLF